MNDKVITFTLIISFVIIGYVIVIKDNPLDNFDKHQCYVLQDRAVEYKDFLYSVENPGGFYITKQDKEMCDFYNIEVDAPIK